MEKIGNMWDEVLESQYSQPYWEKLVSAVDVDYGKCDVFPPYDLIFQALKIVNYPLVKVVILGQDPYHGFNQANGLAFSVNDGIDLPPSLVNIYREIEKDCHCTMPKSGNLMGWAEQGVLLLNTTLTVKKSQPQSHSGYGWQMFTDAIISACSKRAEPMVFILWGANAISKKPLIADRHLVLTSPHPSPLSAYRGFFGSAPFSKANKFLIDNKLAPIDWSMSNKNNDEHRGKIIRVVY